eukprot:1156229-Pelagomonas_calceolata.AAC.16
MGALLTLGARFLGTSCCPDLVPWHQHSQVHTGPLLIPVARCLGTPSNAFRQTCNVALSTESSCSEYAHWAG